MTCLPAGPEKEAKLHQVGEEYYYSCLNVQKNPHFFLFLQLAPQIKARMMEKGSAMIGYQPLGTKVNFFRCVLSNPATKKEDVDFLLDQIVQLGHDL